MKKYYLFLAVIALIFASCQNSDNNKTEKITDTVADFSQEDKDLLTKSQAMFKTTLQDAEAEVSEITMAQIKLGKILYFDTRLSMNETQSCNTCHNLSTYGVDNLPTSPGDNGELGTRNSPTVIYAALNGKQFWDGRAADVEEQAGMPITNPVEMAIPNEQFLVDRLSKIEGYKTLFAAAFPDEKEPLTFANIQKAIAEFEKTLITVDNFDKYLMGDISALNEQERKGLNTFISTGCATCHAGVAVGGDLFMKFGLFQPYEELTNSKVVDKGKFDVTGNEADMFVFKSPSLRNIAKTSPYFHDGSVESLEQAIDIMAKAELGKELSEQEISEIATFLNALTGELPDEVKTAPQMVQ